MSAWEKERVRQAGEVDATEVAASAPDDRSAGRGRALEREGRVFCRYLLAAEPTDYLLGRYVAAHRARADLEPASSLDKALLELAVEGPMATRIADAYGRIFAPRGLLRRKLTLLLAIAESSPELHRRVEEVDPAGRARLVAGLAVEIAFGLLALAGGAALLLPVHLLSWLRDRCRSRAGARAPLAAPPEGG